MKAQDKELAPIRNDQTGLVENIAQNFLQNDA